MTKRHAHTLVAIGASWGGLGALRTILQALPAELDAAVVVVHPDARVTPVGELAAILVELGSRTVAAR